MSFAHFQTAVLSRNVQNLFGSRYKQNKSNLTFDRNLFSMIGTWLGLVTEWISRQIDW